MELDLRNTSVLILAGICKGVEVKMDHSSRKFGSEDKGRQIKGSSNF